MELEQRVKALEYEIKILKNEIQRTLLDIQEQILIHYYPSLRAGENTGPSEGVRQSLESIRDKQVLRGEAPPTVSQVPSISEAIPGAAVKKISLEEIRAMQEEDPTSNGGNSAPSGGKTSQVSIAELSGWVSNSVKKIGGERTIKMIKICARRNWFTPESENTLLRLASLSSDDAPETVAVNEVLTSLLRLNELLQRNDDVEEVLMIIEEAGLG